MKRTDRYSVLSVFTGFDKAARIAWKLIVNSAMKVANAPASTNVHHDRPIR